MTTGTPYGSYQVIYYDQDFTWYLSGYKQIEEGLNYRLSLVKSGRTSFDTRKDAHIAICKILKVSPNLCRGKFKIGKFCSEIENVMNS